MNIITILFVSTSVLLSGCSSCSKSGQKQRLTHTTDHTESRREKGVLPVEKTVVKMEKINGVYQIPVEVNGVKMYFIFDTGASIISISETEANFLWKQGKLTKDDIKGTANFSDANGDITEGTIIVLSTVKIGDRILKNIEASVVHNLYAPLLFGQSALSEFGKISIDNLREEIIFE